MPEFVTLDQPATDPDDVRLQFFPHSPLALSAHDSLGREISATTSTLPGATYRRFGEVQYISLPVDASPELKLTGYASGMFTLDIREVKGNNIITSTVFSSIPTTTSTRVRMEFSDGRINTASPLKIDMNGDGSTEFSLIAKLNEKVYLDPVTKKQASDNFTR